MKKSLQMYYMHKLLFSIFSLTVFFSSSTWSQTAVRPPGGGRDEDPYLVSTLEHLYYLCLNSGGGVFIQVADIDASATRYWDGGKGFLPIGTLSTFRGGYDGNGYIIKNLYINRPTTDKIGFFSDFFGLGIVKNVGLVNVDITGRNNVGGLCGSVNYFSEISGCFVTGKISGASNVGGLVGGTNETEITNCYSNCTVQGIYHNTGGFVGINYSTIISNCYAVGDVTGKYSTGGFAGSNFSGSSTAMAIISSCYSSGTVNSPEILETGAFVGYNSSYSIVTNSHWNDDIVGVSNDVAVNSGIFAACSGLTTDQMKQLSNFSGNWLIRAGKTYPALSNVADNAPFTFREVISKHSGTFEISALLANDYDYETLQNNLVLKIQKLSAGTHDNLHIHFPASANMGDTVTVHYKVGVARSVHNDTIWGNTVASLLVYSNRAPVISAVPSYAVQEDSHFVLSVDEITAADPDNDPFTIHIFEGDDYQVTGSTIIPDLNFNGTLRVGIGASDGAFMSDTAFLDLTVTPVNDTPKLTGVLEKTIPEDSELLLFISDLVCNDPDGDELDLVFGEGSNFSISGDTLRPDQNFNGNLQVPMSVTDGEDTSVVMMMHITVTPVNDAPEIISAAPLNATEGTEHYYAVTASDVDNHELSYSLTWRPAGMSISSDGIIRWIPPAGITTSGNVTVIVSDGTLEVSQTYTISVVSSNLIPVATDTSIVISQNETADILVSAYDPDGSINTIIIASDPLFGSTSRSGLTITYIPDENFFGDDSLTWYAIDNKGALSEPAVLKITVNDVNYAPDIISVASANAIAGELYTYEVIATDADNDSLIYGLTNEPAGMTIDEHGVINWIAGEGIITSGEVTLTVSDGVLEVTQVFIVEVEQIVSSSGNEIINTEAYPNPCKDQFTINAGVNPGVLRIYDLYGKIVHTQQVQGKSEVNIGFLSNGTYIIDINGTHTKIIKSF